MKTKTLLTLGILTAVTFTSQAAITWTGGGAGNEFYDDANWDFTASTSSTMATPTDDDVTITSATITDAGGSISIGNGFIWTLDATSYDLNGGAGFSGVAGGGQSTINLVNGSILDGQFATVGLNINVDASSTFKVNGAGDPINSQTEQTTVNLSTGAKLIFGNTAELADQLDDAGTGDIYVNGTRVTAGNQATLLSTSDNLTYTALAVPEPSSTALLGLGGLALILRRRK